MVRGFNSNWAENSFCAKHFVNSRFLKILSPEPTPC